MRKSKIEIHRCFIGCIDSAKKYVDYNEYVIDPDSEMWAYMQNFFAYNYDNVSAKKSSFTGDSFLAQILPEDATGFDAFVDVIADELHSLLQEAVDLPNGSGLFMWALVEEQPVIGFFKLNFQNKFGCVVDDDGKVEFKTIYRLLPTHTQKEYDYFFINIYEQKVWMSDTRCHVNGESMNYMADRILKLELNKSEKEIVQSIENVVMDTIKECYKNEAPNKVFEYRQSVAEEAADYESISPEHVEKTVFADNEAAKEVYRRKLEEIDIPPQKPVEVSKKTQRQLKKKQKIVTENGIEILVPIEYLENTEVFEFRQEETGSVSIVIKDVKGNLK